MSFLFFVQIKERPIEKFETTISPISLKYKSPFHRNETYSKSKNDQQKKLPFSNDSQFITPPGSPFVEKNDEEI
jgi:hypothetical protein